MEQTLKIWLKRLKLHESTMSMFLGGLVIAIVALLVYRFFQGRSAPQPQPAQVVDQEEYTLELLEEAKGEIVPQGLPAEHTVSQGEHLWSISEKYYGNGYNWIDIARENALVNPGMILVDQRLVIPRVKLRVVDATLQAKVQSGAATINGDRYTVSKGDTLWQIAVRAYQDGYQWPTIYQANREIISDPDLIEIGMELSLPRS